jgi:hypothetical protein
MVEPRTLVFEVRADPRTTMGPPYRALRRACAPYSVEEREKRVAKVVQFR